MKCSMLTALTLLLGLAMANSATAADSAAAKTADPQPQPSPAALAPAMDAATKAMVDKSVADSQALVNKLMDSSSTASVGCKAMAAKVAAASGEDLKIAVKYLADNCE